MRGKKSVKVQKTQTVLLTKLSNLTFIEHVLFSYMWDIHEDHIRGHETNAKCKRSEITVSIFSDQNRFKVEINNQKISGKSLNNWRLENTFQQPTGQTSHKGNKYSELNENENMVY